VDRRPLRWRAQQYARAFPQWPDSWPVVATGRWLQAVWVTGACYRGSGYHGSYPRRYLARVRSMFPDRCRTLHLFSGSLRAEPATVRLDLQPNPEAKADVRGDARALPFRPASFDLVLADTPYTDKDARIYGVPKVPHRLAVLREVARVLEPGGFAVWLDTINPQYRKSELLQCGLIAVVGSTNHAVRLASIYRHR